MTIRAAFAKSLLAGFLMVAGGTMLAPVAHAQHVVTDYEAGKLTFDALTATPRPVVRRVAYRPVYRMASAAHASRSFYGRTAPVVQAVAYRRTAHAVGHAAPVAAHRRRRG